MAETSQDRLILLKGRYISQIATKKEELADLEKKLKVIEEVTSEANELFPSQTTSESLAGKGISEAALITVNMIGKNGGVSSGAVASYMISNGFTTTSKNFRVILGQTLDRLREKGKILGSQEAKGKPWFYKAN